MAIDRLKKQIGKGRHASSIKRDRQNRKLRLKNKSALSEMRTAIKNTRASKSAESLKIAIPIIAKAAQKGFIHRKKASRLISRLMKGHAAA